MAHHTLLNAQDYSVTLARAYEKLKKSSKLFKTTFWEADYTTRACLKMMAVSITLILRCMHVQRNSTLYQFPTFHEKRYRSNEQSFLLCYFNIIQMNKENAMSCQFHLKLSRMKALLSRSML